MCNIAGFIGTTRAAPKLIELIGRQEGLNGGYYTGIATMTDDGRIHVEKVVGDVSTLLHTTKAADLPGNVGIIHSRTKSGGGRAWSHPFVGNREDIAYIANGSVGMFHPSKERDAATKRLVEAGYAFSATSDQEIGRYPRLPGGGSVHMSDVMCHLIDDHIRSGDDPASAMGRAFIEAPSEIVGMMVHASMPGHIIATRINQPLMIGRHEDGWVLASTALAFEHHERRLTFGDGLDDVKIEWTVPMAPCSTAVFSRDALEVSPFRFVTSIAPTVPLERARRTVLDGLEEGKPKTFSELAQKVKALWPEETLVPSSMTTYETIRSLFHDGRIRFDTIHVPGVEAPLRSPQTRVVKV